MSKDTNKQAAEKLFASTAHEVLYANPKGEFFTSENIGVLSLKPGQKLEKFERTPEVVETKAKALNATQSIEVIEQLATLEDLHAFEADERKTVKEAYAKRHAELVAVIEVKASEGTDGNEETEDKK